MHFVQIVGCLLLHRRHATAECFLVKTQININWQMCTNTLYYSIRCYVIHVHYTCVFHSMYVCIFDDICAASSCFPSIAYAVHSSNIDFLLAPFCN